MLKMLKNVPYANVQRNYFIKTKKIMFLDTPLDPLFIIRVWAPGGRTIYIYRRICVHYFFPQKDNCL